MTTRILRADGWAVLASMALLLAWFLMTPPAWNLLDARPPLPVTLLAWLLQVALLAWKHRADLRRPPTLRAHRAAQTP